MPLDFPTSPSVNDIYTANGKSWLWDGVSWKAYNSGYTGSKGDTGTTGYTGSVGDTGTTGFTGSIGDQGTTGYTGSVGGIGYTGSSSITVSSTAPSSPSTNDLWVETPGVMAVPNSL